MTTKEITFFFNKTPGTLNLRILDARPALVNARQEELSKAVSTIFDALIQANEAKYREQLLNLSTFSVTLLNPLSEKPSLKIESPEYSLHLTKVKPATAALFLHAVQISQNPQLSAAEKAQQKAAKLHQELLEDNSKEAVSPIVSIEVTQPGGSVSLSPPKEPVAVEPKKTAVNSPDSEWKPTEQERLFATIFMNMNERFVNTMIRLSQNIQQNFGDYMMSRLFVQATSYSYDENTNEFKMVFDKERSFNLTNLPENISAESREDLKNLQNSVLKLAKEIKGKFNKDRSISFEPGALTIEWPKGWTSTKAQLLSMYESQGDTVTLGIKYGYLPYALTSPLAQDFVEFVDCNLPK